MKYQNVRIESFGHVLPGRVVTSEEVEAELASLYERLNLVSGRLELMTGVRERRLWEDGTPPSQVSALAGARAIESSKIDRAAIECLLHTSVCRDFLEPATASVVHHSLGLSAKAFAFDITNACLGFLNGMVSVANMIELGQIKAGLVVAGECAEALFRTTILQLNDDPEPTRQKLKLSFPSLTIGSGAVAAVLTHSSISQNGHRLLGGVFRSASEHYRLCQGSKDTGTEQRHPMSMETQAETLMREGCKLARNSWQLAKEELSWSNDSVNRTFCHQVGRSHRKLLFESLELDPEKDFETLSFLGNTGSAALPLTMSIAMERGSIEAGERVLMLGIGSGLNCLFLAAEW